MIYFTQRRKLAELFKKWCRENSVLYDPMSMVSWMMQNQFLKEDEVKEYLKNNET